ncbi:MAG: HAMP domain-containing histidine kinase, partial [Sphingomonadales bacterium]
LHVEACRFDMEALTEKLKGAAEADRVGLRRELPAGRLTVGRHVQASGPLRSALIGYALVTAALLLGLSALAAWLVGRLFTARIATLNRVCSEVEAGNVGARLEDKGSDEIAMLSRHLNRMLSELERRMSNLRASSDRIAHDLRTPLARLGSRLSLLAGMPPAEHAAQIAAAQREIGNLIEAFNGLLDLREIETESGLSRTRFDLADAVGDAIELYDAVAEDQQGIAIERRLASVDMEGVPALLTRAVANLIDNALHAAPPGSVITVAAFQHGGDAVIEVRDTGQGPPDQVVAALGDDISHSSGWGGHGVGLSIVAAVARRHGGSFGFAREGGETIARLQIPLARDA